MSKNLSDAEILEGINRQELIYYYQPQISFLTGKISGVEALVRWKKDNDKLISPDLFIPQSEKSGLIKQITQYLVPTLGHDFLIIQDAINHPIDVSINLSARDFDDRIVAHQLMDLAKQKLISPKLIHLEVTESAVLEPKNHILENFRFLGDSGFHLTMDDYGKEYSNLSSLARWPFSTVKLDKEFIDGMSETNIAEGIESEKVYNSLLHAGCSIAQGYWLAKPMPLEELLVFINQGKSWTSSPVGLLKMAQHDHLQWRNEIIQIVAEILQLGQLGDRVSIPALSHVECRLGKWYLGMGRQFSHHPSYLAIKQPHSDLHNIGNELLTLAHQQSISNREQIINKMKDFSRVSGVVLTHLQQLEHEVMVENIF